MRGRGGGHATHFLATANTKAAAGSRLNWKGCGKEYETRRKKQARNKEEVGVGERELQMEAKSMCLCERMTQIPCKASGRGILKCRKKKFY